MIGYRLGKVWVFPRIKKSETLVNQGFPWCGKQDLKSETAVNSVQFCIILACFETNLHNSSKYHAL